MRFVAIGMVICSTALAGCTLFTNLDDLDDLRTAQGRDGGLDAIALTSIPVPEPNMPSPNSPDGGPKPILPPTQKGFYRQLTIQNMSTSELPAGYSVSIPLKDILPKSQPDGSDIHVMGSAAERDRFIGLAESNAPVLWFSLAAPIESGATSTDYGINYGHQSSAPPANPSNVFSFYDGFDSSTISSGWTVSGSPLQTSGILSLSGVQTVRLISTYLNATVEFRASVSQPIDNGGYFGFDDGSQSYATYSLKPNGLVGLFSNGYGQTISSPISSAISDYHIYRITRRSTGTEWDVDGTVLNVTDSGLSASLPILMRNKESSYTTMAFDWVRVRIAADVEPTVVVGAEQGGKLN